MPTAGGLDRPLTELRGVGPQLATRLQRLGLTRVRDLLFHLPLRYLDRTRLTPIGALQPLQEVVIEGEIKVSDVIFSRRRSLACRLQDNTGVVTLRFYHFNRSQQERLKPGTRLRCFGEVRRGRSGLEMYHPEYQLLDDSAPPTLEKQLTPVYPASEGITQQRIRDLCAQSLLLLSPSALTELLPQSLLNSGSASLIDSLRLLHNPPPNIRLDQLADGRHPAQKRLALEELVAHHLSLLKLRLRMQQNAAPALTADKNLQQRFVHSLPFELTAAQRRVSEQISRDIGQPRPMLRLLQGDVGSGKTVVAALAALQAAASGFQTAIMAPTEILAEQHRMNFQNWLGPMDVPLGWLTGKQKGKARDYELGKIANGEARIVIGTHALFQDDVHFQRLGLTIIDEQHRFGVHQRLRLRRKSGSEVLVPHQLIMTATPIPRTLAMSAYADLDVSVIDELPPGRTPVNTSVFSNIRRAEVIERVRQGCADGRQAYWVCTLIEESEALEAEAAQATADELALLFPELKIGLVHGRLKPGEKSRVMDGFKAGNVQLLVATTVIEVGVDVPNASLMIIDNAERLGLSQLHQLRGRVGRGAEASYCVLLYTPPLSQLARQRLGVMRDTNDGFRIAERDLQLRGPGELLGTRQTGELQLRIADLRRDAELLDQVRNIANVVFQKYPDRVDPLIERWLGTKSQYAQA